MPSPEYDRFYRKAVARAIDPNLTLEEIRASFERLMAGYPAAPDIRFEPFSIGSLPACWAFAPNANKQSILLFFHGGGFTAGSIRSHHDLIGRLSRASQSAVLAIGYRLAPEHPFPAALEDAEAAYHWLLRHPHSPKQIALAGISAGGNLALALCLRLKLEKRPMPLLAALLCPWTDLTVSSPSCAANAGKDLLDRERLLSAAALYCDGKNPKEPLISPLYADLHGLPPLLVQTGSRELFFDEAVALAQKAKESGVETTLEKWPDMLHAWQLFASFLPEGVRAIDAVGSYILER